MAELLRGHAPTQGVIDEFLAFSDLHAHNFPFGAKRVVHDDPVKFPGLYNSRLMDAVRAVRHVAAYAVEHRVKTVVFGRDLFHRRSIQHTDAYNLIVHELHQMVDAGLQLVMIPGNHDYADRLGQTHALQSIRHPSIDVGSSVELFCPGGRTSFITVPYTDDLEEAKRRLSQAGALAEKAPRGWPYVLLAHLGMQGATVGSDYVLVSKGDVVVADVPYEKFNLCLFGHFHEHQRLFSNGWYIGATTEQNWADSGGKRGFLHCKMLADGSTALQHMVIPSAPKFLNVSQDNVSTVPVPGDFVRMFVPQGVPWVVEDSELLGSFEVLVQEPVDNDKSRLTLSADQLDPERALSAWVAEHPHETLTPEALLAVGRELLRKAKGG